MSPSPPSQAKLQKEFLNHPPPPPSGRTSMGGVFPYGVTESTTSSTHRGSREKEKGNYFEKHTRTGSGGKSKYAADSIPRRQRSGETLSSSYGREKDRSSRHQDGRRDQDRLAATDLSGSRIESLPTTPEVNVLSPTEGSGSRTPSPDYINRGGHRKSRGDRDGKNRPSNLGRSNRTSHNSARSSSKPIPIPSLNGSNTLREKSRDNELRGSRQGSYVSPNQRNSRLAGVKRRGSSTRCRRHPSESPSDTQSITTATSTVSSGSDAASYTDSESDSETDSENSSEGHGVGGEFEDELDVLKPSSISRTKEKGRRKKKEPGSVLAITYPEEKEQHDPVDEGKPRSRSHRKRSTDNNAAQRTPSRKRSPPKDDDVSSSGTAAAASPPSKRVRTPKLEASSFKEEPEETGLNKQKEDSQEPVQRDSSLSPEAKHRRVSSSPRIVLSRQEDGKAVKNKESQGSLRSSQDGGEEFHSPLGSEHPSRAQSTSPALDPDLINLPTSVSRAPSSTGSSPRTRSPIQKKLSEESLQISPSLHKKPSFSSSSESSDSGSESDKGFAESEVGQRSQTKPIAIPGSAPRSRASTPQRPSRRQSPARKVPLSESPPLRAGTAPPAEPSETKSKLAGFWGGLGLPAGLLGGKAAEKKLEKSEGDGSKPSRSLDDSNILDNKRPSNIRTWSEVLPGVKPSLPILSRDKIEGDRSDKEAEQSIPALKAEKLEVDSINSPLSSEGKRDKAKGKDLKDVAKSKDESRHDSDSDSETSSESGSDSGSGSESELESGSGSSSSGSDSGSSSGSESEGRERTRRGDKSVKGAPSSSAPDKKPRRTLREVVGSDSDSDSQSDSLDSNSDRDDKTSVNGHSKEMPGEKGRRLTKEKRSHSNLAMRRKDSVSTASTETAGSGLRRGSAADIFAAVVDTVKGRHSAEREHRTTTEASRDAEGDLQMNEERNYVPQSPPCNCSECEFKNGCPRCHYHHEDGSIMSGDDRSSNYRPEDMDKNMFQDLKEYKEATRKYQQEIENMHTDNNELQKERNKLVKRLEKYEQAYDRKEAELEDMNKACKDLHTKLEELQEQHRQEMDREIKRQIAVRDKDWDKTWKEKNNHLIRDLETSRSQRHSLEKLISEKEQEIRDLDTQIQRLKHDISLSTRTEAQKTDDLFNQDMGDLWRNLQQWVFLNFKTKVVFDNLPEHTKKSLAEVTNGNPELIMTKRLFVISALISDQLVEAVFSPYLFGLTKETNEGLSTLELYLASLSNDPEYSAAINLWRSTTLSMIRKHALPRLPSVSSAPITAHLPSANADALADTSLGTAVEDLLLHITASLTPLGLSPSPEPREKLRHIIETAVNLAIELRVQRASFSVRPEPLLGADFNPETMEDLDGGEDDDWRGKKVGCVAWPALWKSGDENGEHPHLTNLIYKAQVILVE